jgi:hypothetical protein
MSKPVPTSDFRAVRHVLEEHEYAIGGEDMPPTDLIQPDVWDGIMHLPDDVAITISNHHGTWLRVLYSLWSDWMEAVGKPRDADKLFFGMLDAADCFQCATFDFLHGYYRSALANMRSALELVTIGTFGNLAPNDPVYLRWASGDGDLIFPSCRKRLLKAVPRELQWLVRQGSVPEIQYYDLCRYTHSRPDGSDGTLWESNGPVYNNRAIDITLKANLSTYAICYLLTKVARPQFNLPRASRILFELDWLPNYGVLHKAFEQLYLTC